MHFLARRKSRALFGAQEESRVVADCDLLPQLSENLASSRTCCRKELRAATSQQMRTLFESLFLSLQWFSGCSASESPDISWVELFMFWVVDCGCVPPFKVDGRWVRVGIDEDAICCVPSAHTLFRTWRRAVAFVLRDRTLVPGVTVPSCVSAVAWGSIRSAWSVVASSGAAQCQA